MSACYFTVINDRVITDRLIAASSPQANDIQIHETQLIDGLVRMRELTEGVRIPARSKIELKPMGTHLMVMGIDTPLAAGNNFPVTLVLEKAGSIRIDFRIEGPGSPRDADTRRGISK